MCSARKVAAPLSYLPMPLGCPQPLSHWDVLWTEKPAGRGQSGDRKELSTALEAEELWEEGLCLDLEAEAQETCTN